MWSTESRCHCFQPCYDEGGNYEELEVSLGAVISRCRHPHEDRDLVITYGSNQAEYYSVDPPINLIADGDFVMSARCAFAGDTVVDSRKVANTCRTQKGYDTEYSYSYDARRRYLDEHPPIQIAQDENAQMQAHVKTINAQMRIFDLLIPIRLNDDVSNLIQTWDFSGTEGWAGLGSGDRRAFESIVGWGPGRDNDNLLEKGELAIYHIAWEERDNGTRSEAYWTAGTPSGEHLSTLFLYTALNERDRVYFDERGTLDAAGNVIEEGYLEGTRYFQNDHYFNNKADNISDDLVYFDEALYFSSAQTARKPYNDAEGWLVLDKSAYSMGP